MSQMLKRLAAPVNTAAAWASLYDDERPPTPTEAFWADHDLRWDGDLPYVGRDGNHDDRPVIR